MKNGEICSKMAFCGGLEREKPQPGADFCNVLGAVFHRETPSVSCVKRPVDQIEMGWSGLFFFHFFQDEPFC